MFLPNEKSYQQKLAVGSQFLFCGTFLLLLIWGFKFSSLMHLPLYPRVWAHDQSWIGLLSTDFWKEQKEANLFFLGGKIR